jgi:uncharacterized protein YciW
MTIFETTILNVSGVAADGAMAKAAMTRDTTMAMSQAAEDAVLRPVECGGFGHELRASLAARVARLAADETLAMHYLVGAGGHAALADLNETGATQGRAAVVAFVDKVANQTRHVAAEDITGLLEAGVSDADIVRLCELVAFLAYQTRVISGLRLMQGVGA